MSESLAARLRREDEAVPDLPTDFHSAKGDVKRLIRQKASAITGRPMSNKAAKKWLRRQIRAKGGERIS